MTVGYIHMKADTRTGEVSRVENRKEPVIHGVKHHPEPQRGEPTVEGRRLVTGMLLVGVVPIDKLKVTPEDEE